MAKQYSFILPVTVFYSVIQRDVTGKDVNTITGQVYTLGTLGAVMPICHAVAVTSAGLTQTYTQRLQVICETNRALPNGATATSCTASETMNKVVEIDMQQMAYIGANFNTGNFTRAPQAIAYGDAVNCTALCDAEQNCTVISSASLSASLLNMSRNWQPGQVVTKTDVMGAVGAAMDRCNRSSGVISATAQVSNTADTACDVGVDTDSQVSAITLPKAITGGATVYATGKRLSFPDPTKSLQFTPVGDMSVFGGPILSVNAVSNRQAIDVQTPTMCFRISPH